MVGSQTLSPELRELAEHIEGIARAIQTAQITPNEGRDLEGRPRHDNPAADELLVQGATVVLGTAPQPGIGHNGGPQLDNNGDGNEQQA